MKKLLLGAAAALAMAAPGVARAEASGYVGLDYANAHVDGVGNGDAWGGEGAVAFDGGSGINFELDGSVLDNDSDTAWGAAGHLFVRDQNYLFGGFVGASTADSDTAWEAGVEANAYFDRWTLAGAVQYANDDDANANAWGVNAQARFFPTDNFRLQAGGGWASIDFGGPGGNDTAWTLGAGGEYQFSSMPISIGVNYAHTKVDDLDITANTWTVALRYNFGGTLYDRDRHGASQADLVGIGGLSL